MFADNKIVLYKDKIMVYNYLKIIEIKNDFIIIDDFKILGSDLQIRELDSYFILIKGKLKGVAYLEEISDNNTKI